MKEVDYDRNSERKRLNYKYFLELTFIGEGIDFNNKLDITG